MTTKPRSCKTCRHWDDYFYEMQGVGTCYGVPPRAHVVDPDGTPAEHSYAFPFTLPTDRCPLWDAIKSRRGLMVGAERKEA